VKLFCDVAVVSAQQGRSMERRSPAGIKADTGLAIEASSIGADLDGHFTSCGSPPRTLAVVAGLAAPPT
jgi:hypothetical protein